MNLRQTFANIALIYQKEMKETLRDRRTLFIMIFLPIVLYPLLILGLNQLLVFQVGKIEEKDVIVGIMGHSDQISAAFRKDPQFKLREGIKDPREAIRSNKVHVVLQIPPDFDHQLAHSRRAPRLLIYFSRGIEQSRMVLSKVALVLRRLLRNCLLHNLELEHKPVAWARPFRIITKDIAAAAKAGGFHFGRLLAIIIVLMAVSFPLYPAIDMAAGEKERGTMETLLISPAARHEIVLGKYLAIFTISMVGSLLNLTSMGITFDRFASLTERHRHRQEQRSRKVVPYTNDLWDVIEEREHTFTAHHSTVIGAVFLDAQHAISAEKAGRLLLWDLQQKKLVRELAKVPEGLVGIALLPDKNGLLLASPNGQLGVWDLKRHQWRWRVQERSQGLTQLWSDRQAQYWVTAGQDTIQLGQTKRCLHTLAGKALALSPDGRHLLFIHENQILLWPVPDGPARPLPVPLAKHRVVSAAFSPQSQYLALGLNNGEIQIFAMEPQRVCQHWQAHDSPVEHLQFTSPKILFSAGADMLTRLWEVPQGTLVKTFEGHEEPITGLAALEKSGQYLTYSTDTTLRLWHRNPRIVFAITAGIIFKILFVLIPLAGLFSALSLALSVFAKSYKEGQYYLTPLMIVVMPMVLLALIPGVNLTVGRCLLPVVGVVLLYKELFLGTVPLLYFVLIFAATFFYAGLALLWAVHLFTKEDVLFRESEEIRWDFWREDQWRQEVPSVGQAVCGFLLAAVLYHFLVGPSLAKWHFLGGQVLSQVLILLLLPLAVIKICRFDLSTSFHLRKPSWSVLGLSIFLAVGGLVVSRELLLLQNSIFPINKHLFEKAFGQFLEQLQKTALVWQILAIAIVPAVCEEFFFRGLLLSSLKKHLGMTKGIIISALLFALMHDLPRFSFTFPMGVLLGIIVVRSGSLYPAMLAHAISNTSALCLTKWGAGHIDLEGHFGLVIVLPALLILGVALWLLWKTTTPPSCANRTVTS